MSRRETNAIEFAPHLDLAPLIQGWEVLNWSVAATGEDIDIFLVKDVEKVHGLRYALGEYAGYDARLLRASEHYHWELPLTGLTRAYINYCLLNDDRFVLLSNERIGQPNATLLDGAGRELSRFWIGDHVEHAQPGPDGHLWVSYYDQGYGKIYSEKGLSCFDSDGIAVEPWWDCPMMDCYAMNVGKDGVWNCGYSYFPIVHVGFDRRQREWHNQVTGATAIVGRGQQTALYGGYHDRAEHLTVLKLTDKGLAVVESECMTHFPDSQEPLWVTGRGPYFHAFDRGIWYRLDPFNG